MYEEIVEILLDPLLGRLITTVIGLVIISVLVRFLQARAPRYVGNRRTLSSVKQALRFLGYVAAIALVAIIFSDQLPGLTVTLGLAGAGIAFALQEVIASVAGWIAISFGQFYIVGDRVELGGIRGDVIQIGVLRTTLMEIGKWVKADQYNGRTVRIANSLVFSDPVYNYSDQISFIWDEITIPVRYGSDHRLAREILLQVAEEIIGSRLKALEDEWEVMRQKYPLEQASVEPSVFLIADDNWMHVTLRYPVDAKQRRQIHDRLFVRVLDAIAETEGRVALASTRVPIDVRLKRED
jgi:small-conductance mechanosensitive channel